MRASGEELAVGQYGVRASDAERDQAIGELKDRYAEGRLSQDTFLYRMDVALRAKDRSELDNLFADLPGPHGQLDQAAAGPVPGKLAAGPDGTGPSAGRGGPRWLARSRLARDRLLLALRGHGQPGTRWRRPPPLCLPPETGKQKFTIGREHACDFTLADLGVSRWHARLYREDETWILTDLGSTNGTRLNGWRVTTGVRVRPGDRVTFGSVTYVFTDRPAGPG
jgi:hypothetical protein